MNRFECLDKARESVTQKAENYGLPKDNAERIAAIWSVILGVEVPPEKVAPCMVGLKLARLIEDPSHEDSWVDIAGYGAYGAEVACKD